jgi:hypothetical protein
MFVFLLSVTATSQRQLFEMGPSVLPLQQVKEGVSVAPDADADGRDWLAKAYGHNYETFNQLRGDSSGFVFDAQTQSYVPVVTHRAPPTEMKGGTRPRSSLWSRVFVIAFGVLAIVSRARRAAPLMRYALALV